MKNIHILPTDKPSRLGFDSVKNLHFVNDYIDDYQNIYITNSEKPKEGEWCIDIDKFTTKPILNTAYSDDVCPTHIKQLKVILTDNEYLIKNGIQSIDDEFLEWFVKNQSCELIKIDSYQTIYNTWLYKIIIPKQETIEEAAEKYANKFIDGRDGYYGFIEGAKWQKEQDNKVIQDLKDRLDTVRHINTTVIKAVEKLKEQYDSRYSKEEVKEIIKLSCQEGMLIQRTINDKVKIPSTRINDFTIKMFEQFKKK